MKKKFLSVVSLFIATALTACSPASTGNISQGDGAQAKEASAQTTEDSQMRVSYIDVGQGDSEFIELPNGQTLLIDAGTNAAGESVVEYIQSLGYTSIDYIVATHPHEDHIGGLDDVINSFDIGDIYMPKVNTDTKTYEDVLDAIAAKNLIIFTAHAGISIVDTDNLSIEMLSPVSDSYDDLNNYSAVIKIVYGNTSFLFTGDAEEQAESEITDDVKADVLKVGHHGSNTSTSDEFLERVSPSVAVISCGKDNKYGHPTEEILNKLSSISSTVLRTDELGTIVIVSDGSKIIYDSNNAE